MMIGGPVADCGRLTTPLTCGKSHGPISSQAQTPVVRSAVFISVTQVGFKLTVKGRTHNPAEGCRLNVSATVVIGM